MIKDYNFVYLHGAYGGPTENWIPWLAAELLSRGASVNIPTFPTPEGQDLDHWLGIFESEVHALSRNTVLIGHSIGSTFAIRILERAETPIRASFLVSGFVRPLNNEAFDKINFSFVKEEVNWERVRTNCSDFFVYNSNNDPYVPLQYGREIADNLHTNLTVIHEGGHINASAGYVQFEPLLVDLVKLLGE